MIVTFHISDNGSVKAEAADNLTPIERLQLVQAIIGERKRRGEGADKALVTCAWCGREVLGRSTKRKFCGVRCRTAAHRSAKGDAPLADDDERPGFEVYEDEGKVVRRLLGG